MNEIPPPRDKEAVYKEYLQRKDKGMITGIRNRPTTIADEVLARQLEDFHVDKAKDSS